jgi:hypothetical protein
MRVRVLPVLAMALALGCFRSTPTRLFTLTAAPPTPADDARAAAFGLGPVTLPDYLERTPIVTRTSATELKLSDRDVWGEPLHAGTTRVLTANLQALLAPERIVAFPWTPADAPALAVSVEIVRFERQPAGEVALDARWTLRRPGHGVLGQHETTCREPLPPDAATPAVVEAMSRCVATLSADVAAAARPALERTR